ncbi:MAG: NUDIX hydrolase [Actinomycetota bacterium]|jgi:8-oxo-dGTP pyrophosphatase MutT (NUDIX family)|nr:NUDIX hydrolase [Actinomycetota bacterium]
MPEAEASDPSAVVRAAGGVVWRLATSGQAEVVVVHRPKYDDWSLPKGKCEPGEDGGACALREVEEETGWRCIPGPELPTVTYVDRKGRPKEVRYWVMTLAEDRDFVANDEVDEARWLTVGEACALLSYERDCELLEAFLASERAGESSRDDSSRAR